MNTGREMKPQQLASVAPASLLFWSLLAGCRSIGPTTVPRDREGYSSALSESWKRQTLLNIVKIRYLDPPIFVDVASIVSGYQLQVAGNVGGQISSRDAIQGNTFNM